MQLDLLGDDISLSIWLALAATIFFLRKWVKSPRLRLPPGPKPLPIFGNLFDMVTVKPWVKYRDWRNQYGSLVYMDLPFQPTIIVTSAKAALDLMEKRSHIYSDRAPCRMDELMSWDFNFGFMPYGLNWRVHRRVFHQYFNQAAVESYHSVQIKETRLFLRRALEHPGRLPQQTRLIFAGTILKVVYGKDVDDLDDEYVKMAQTAMEGQALGHIPGAHWVEYFPIMKRIPSWVPGAGFQKLADEYRPYVEGMVQKPFMEMRKAVLEGTALQSIARTLIVKAQELGEGLEEQSTRGGIIMRTLAIAYTGKANIRTDSTLRECSKVWEQKLPTLEIVQSNTRKA